MTATDDQAPRITLGHATPVELSRCGQYGTDDSMCPLGEGTPDVGVTVERTGLATISGAAMGLAHGEEAVWVYEYDNVPHIGLANTIVMDKYNRAGAPKFGLEGPDGETSGIDILLRRGVVRFTTGRKLLLDFVVDSAPARATAIELIREHAIGPIVVDFRSGPAGPHREHSSIPVVDSFDTDDPKDAIRRIRQAGACRGRA